jgi:uncharacterized protein YicC (UPF0701 family)
MLWSLIFTLAAHAATPEQTKRVLEAQPECANFVRVVGEKLMLGFGAYWPVMGAPARSAIPSTLKVVDLGDESLLTTRALDAGVDALEADGQLFVLTYEGLEERDLLTLELRRRKDSIARLVDDVAARTATAVADKQAKLRERLAVLLGEHLEPGRLVAELALMAERLDVTEELARLRLHLEQLEQLLLTARSGRRIDFLCQEFLREANTVASKCADATTAHLVVELKAEIERLREQAQNVE